MNKNLICIICPRGCSLTVDVESKTVSGNACDKGKEYGIAECLNPVRTVTSIIKVSNREDTMVSVKTSKPIKKSDIGAIMNVIRNAQATAPIRIGEVLIPHTFGADIIATKNID